MSKIKNGYVNKRDNFFIKTMKITPLLILLGSIGIIFGYCYIASN
jgi:hypothetical protein